VRSSAKHHFERDLRALIFDPIAADAFVEAAEFILARDPRSGIQDELSPEL